MTRKNLIDTDKKSPAENARAFFITLCTGFTVIMVVCLAFGTAFADEQAKQGIFYCWSILGACVAAAALQFVFFTPTIIKRMAYPIRLLLFGICLYVVLAITAVTMNWFPSTMVGAWISFTIIYLVMLAAATAFFYFKHKKDSRELNDKLSEYRNQHN